ncbi:hypothetical protein DAETH_48460 (plasmid) [Deinococcus aetherius]|uniref:SF4 helicase domain-containing protein n=1 Tax=Deinococcus aetherius TaxID=200252 RepID=A0ABN6RNM0_9DEIO|nr:DnaB-like helicase C-terminal domain-containing protein [Deinococcus aetherius]BDP44877.1 hypothetical protein DAETH_48460 [Deinococcus aetherius]
MTQNEETQFVDPDERGADELIANRVHDAFEEVTLLFERRGGSRSLFGLRDLDEQILVQRGPLLVLLVGRSGMGRSALAGHIALHTDVTGQVVYHSADLSPGMATLRMLLSGGRVDLTRTMLGWLSEREFEQLAHVASPLAERDMYLTDASPMNLEDLVASTRARHEVSPLGLVVVDGLELLDLHSGQQMDAALRVLRGLSRALWCPVIVTLPVGRGPDRRSNKRPQIVDIEVAPAAEGLADVIIGLYRDDFYHRESDRSGIAELIIMKQKNGPVGTALVQVQPQMFRFNNLAPEEVQRLR